MLSIGEWQAGLTDFENAVVDLMEGERSTAVHTSGTTQRQEWNEIKVSRMLVNPPRLHDALIRAAWDT